jgi:hypothetical protein
MTAEYTRKTKQPDYALASYRLPYKGRHKEITRRVKMLLKKYPSLK